MGAWMRKCVGLVCGLQRRGLLGGVRIGRALVNFQLGQEDPAEAVLRHHAADGAMDELLGMPVANLGDGPVLLATLPAGVGHVHLVGLLFAGQADLFRVDDHDEIAGVEVRGVDWRVPAAEKIGDLDSETTQDRAVGIDDMPLALIQIHFRQIRFHFWPVLRSGETNKGKDQVNRHFGKSERNHWQDGPGHGKNPARSVRARHGKSVSQRVDELAGQRVSDSQNTPNEFQVMSQHRSLRSSGTSSAKRNVLKRYERVELLKKRTLWKTGDRVTGLRKTKPDV